MARQHLRASLRPVLAALATTGLALSGCGDDEWKADTVVTTGKITINGEAPKGLLVELHPTTQVDARNSRSWGKVKEDGTYSLSAYEDREGVPPGDYSITLVWPVDSSVLGSPDRLGHRYDRPELSMWKVKVLPGPEQELPPIDLTNVAVKEKPKTSAAEAKVAAP